MAAHGHPTVAAVLVAAGDGVRLGASTPKAFVSVAGRTMLEHAARRFTAHPSVRDVVIAAPVALTAQASALVADATVVAGGSTRQQSVSCALDALADDVDIVLVHDVARAFVPAEVISRVVAAVADGADAAVPTVPVTDTVRRCDPVTGHLGEVVDRATLRAVQTPQGFRRDALVQAHRLGAHLAVTDDAALVEARGGQVVAVTGDERSFKITVPLDLLLAEAVARG